MSKFLNYDAFISINVVFILANSADPDEMPSWDISPGSSLFAKVPVFTNVQNEND